MSNGTTIDVEALRRLAREQGIETGSELHAACAVAGNPISLGSAYSAWNGYAGLKILTAVQRTLGCRLDDLVTEEVKNDS